MGESPAVQCAVCGRATRVSIERYPLQGGTFPCPSCEAPIVLVPRAAFLKGLKNGEADAQIAHSNRRPVASSPPKGTPSSVWRIAVYGGGVEEIALGDLRSRIRRQEVVRTTEVTPPGSELWASAGDRPELAGWLREAEEETVAPRATASTSPRESVVARALSGLLYPVSESGVPILVVFSVAQIIPGFGYVVGPATAVWILAILRESSRGNRRMPSDVTSDLPVLLETASKVALVSLVTLLPVIGLLAWGMFRGGPEMSTKTFQLALAVSVLWSLFYYPASLATVAVWDQALPALSPMHVLRVVRIMRSDYAIAVILGTVGVCAGVLLGRLASSILGGIPVVGSVPGFLITTWAAFWAGHVLGWAVYRHAPELGWN